MLRSFFFSNIPPPPCSTLFPYTTLFRSAAIVLDHLPVKLLGDAPAVSVARTGRLLLKRREHLIKRFARDRKSTRLNSSHVSISYAVFCLKKKKNYHHFPGCCVVRSSSVL